jgi:hypothetical protein
MEVKGTAVKTIPKFVQEKFPEEYSTWLKSLPEASAKIMSSSISLTKWYSLKNALIIPTRLIGEMFYNDVEQGAFELGVYSSQVALKGIYKILVKVSSPSFIVSRAPGLLESYYRPTIMAVTEKSNTHAVLSIIDFPEPDVAVDYRIYGWIKNTMESSNFHLPEVSIRKSLGKGDFVTEYLITWVA